MTSLCSTKPFAKKTFFLDLKGFQNQIKLAQDLKLLGGKQELSMSKNVSFVVSNKIPVKSSQLWSPVTPSPNPRSMSPHLFNDSTMDDMYSPAYTDSPGIEQTPCIMSRGKSILQMVKEKKSGTSNVMDICKKWKIKVYNVKKVLSWVEKYKGLYYKNHLAEQKLKKFSASNESVQKIHSPFIKLEDRERKYKPKYKALTSWTDIIDPSISQFVSQLHKNLKTGNINDSFRLPLRELDIRPLCSAQSTLTNRSVSISKMSVISNSVSIYAPIDGGKENFSHSHVKRKGKDKKKTKKRYCEICDVHFTELEMHVGKKSHERYMSNTDHYKKVHDIISSLPRVDDFLKSIQDEIDQEDFQDYLFKDVPNSVKGGGTDLSEDAQLLLQGNDAENCMTELYSINPNDYISASCSSTGSTSFPNLEPVYNDNYMENQCDKDLCPPTSVYCSTVECTGSYFTKTFLENLGLDDVENNLPNLNKVSTNTSVEINQLSNYGSGSNSCDVQMDDVRNQKQISNNGLLCTFGNEINNAGVSCIERNAESKSSHLSDAFAVISNCSMSVIPDVVCPEVPLPDLICTETDLSVTNDHDKMEVQAEPVKYSTVAEMDVHDSFTHKVHEFPPEQNKFPSELNIKSDPESAYESILSCENIIKSFTEMDVQSNFTHKVDGFSSEQNMLPDELNTESHPTESVPKSDLSCKNHIKSITNMDAQDSFTHKVHRFPSEQNKFPDELNTKSCVTESVNESHLSCKSSINFNLALSATCKSESEISTDSNVNEDIKDEELTSSHAVSFSRNLAYEFESVALQTSEVKNESLNIINGNNLLEDKPTSSNTCSTDYTSKIPSEFFKEAQASENVNINTESNIACLKMDECHVTEPSLKYLKIAQVNTQKNDQISKENAESNEVTLDVESPDKLPTLKDSSVEKLSTLNVSYVDTLDLNKNEESIQMSIDTSCSAAVPIILSLKRVESSVSKEDKNQSKVNKNCGQSVHDLTSTTVQDERTTDDLPAHLNVISEDCSMNNSISEDVGSNETTEIARPLLNCASKSESNSPISLDKNTKTHCLVMANGRTLPFSMKNLNPEAQKLLKNLFVKEYSQNSDSLRQENIHSPEICVKDSESFSTSIKGSPKTVSDAWNSSNAFYVVDDVTPEKSPDCSNMDYCNSSGKVSYEEISCPVDISHLNEQSKESSHNSLNNNIPIAPINNSVVPDTLPSPSVVENMKEKYNMVFIDSSSDSGQIFKQDVILNAGCFLQNFSESVSNLSSGSKPENCNYSNEADFSSSPEKEDDWDIIHHEVDTLCKSIDAEEKSDYQMYDSLQLVM